VQLETGRAHPGGGVAVTALEAIREELPEAAKDVKLNLQAVLQESSLSAAQRWGVAIASAATARNRRLLEAAAADALRQVEPAVVDDALAAAALMAMNNVCTTGSATWWGSRPTRRSRHACA
jgi:hypothetical protein